jgi:hypothetical protein
MTKNVTKTLVAVGAALLMQSAVNAQAFKFPIFEHFTQASCGPCAAQNPGFQTSILDANPTSVHHIAYHTVWPGVDPMNALNPVDVDARVGYYNVTGVPSVTLMGNAKTGGPGSFSQADVDAQIAATSPIKVNVSQVDNGNNRDITVVITTVGNVPVSSNYVLQTVVVERNITYASAPGNNGETYFPNVMRQMLPNPSGTAVTIPALGTTAVYTFNVVENAAWNDAEIAVIAFVQDDNTKAILNSGATWDPQVNAIVIPPTVLAQAGTIGTATTFNSTIANSSLSSEDYNIALTAVNAPATWTANFMVNGTTYTSNATVTLASAGFAPTDIMVTPDAAPGLAEYTLTITSVTNPTAPAMFYKVYVVSGINTLLINNSSGKGDGTGGSAALWEADYINGLTFANCSTYAVCNEITAMRCAADNALIGVDKIFLNIGWTFPSLTDELVAQLSPYLDNGGRLLISGQDIGWETMDAASTYSTPNTQAFYTNYLNATYLNDGTTAANVALNFNASDAVFTGTPSSTLLNYYGGTYFFPDEMNAVGNGAVISYYGTGTNKKAAVRATNGVYKTVYLGYGLEMVSSTITKNEIIKKSYDWFNNILTTEEFDAQMLALNIGQNFPNPGADMVSIPVSNLMNDATLEVMDVTGRLVLTQNVTKQSDMITVNTKGLQTGLYTYRLVSESKTTATKVMQVVR